MAHELSTEMWRGIAHLWREAAELRVANPSELAASIVRGAMRVVGADDGYVILASRNEALTDDPLNGWRVVRLFEPFACREKLSLVDEFAERQTYVVDERTVALVREAGTLRAHLRFDAIDEATWRSSPSRRLQEELGVRDQVVGAVPLGANLEMYLGLQSRSARAFDTADREALKQLLSGLVGPGLRLMHACGMAGQGELTPREREVLEHLLDGLAEKEIASELTLSTRTVHHHVTSVYRKVGVHSRGELMGRWLGPR